MGRTGEHKRVLVSVGALVAGVLFLVASWVMQRASDADGNQWLADVLVNLGAAVLLIVPIEWISAGLARRVDEVQEESAHAVAQAREEASAEVAGMRAETAASLATVRGEVEGLREEVDARLSEFADQSADRFAAELDEDAASFRRLGELAPTRDLLVDALQRATARRLISELHGLRARTHEDSDVYLRLRYRDDFSTEVSFVLEAVDGTYLTETFWEPEQSADDVILHLRREVDTYEGGNFDVAYWFTQISTALSLSAGSSLWRRIVEICPPQWAVVDDGIRPYPRRGGYQVGRENLLDPNFSAGVRQKTWVDPDSFDRASESWLALFSRQDSTFRI